MANRTIGHGLKDCLPSEYQNFLEKGKQLVVGVSSVACVVSRHCPIFMIFGILQEYCRKLLVLPPTNTVSMVPTYSLGLRIYTN